MPPGYVKAYVKRNKNDAADAEAICEAVSLAAQALLGAWWVDPVGSLAIVWFLVKEGREAWSGEECGCD